MQSTPTASPDEIARFSALAESWWDPAGAFKALHGINPVRLDFLRRHVAAHFGRRADDEQPFRGLRFLDIGCGGGLMSEPVCRLGGAVTGIDASEKGIRAARLHAQRGGLEIDYRCLVPEALGDVGTYQVVLNMEVVEHVADRDAFLAASCRLVGAGGVMAVSTLNRTLKSLALAKVGAEYVLRWLPAGTHDWGKFTKPSELTAGLGRHGLRVTALEGIAYNLLADRWSSCRELDVNYLAFAVRDR